MDQQGTKEEMWNETMAFLDGVQDSKGRAVEDEIRRQQDGATVSVSEHHAVVDITDASKYATKKQRVKSTTAGFPSVVLSHVPFYRAPGTPCGPLRERSPPTAQGLEVDEPNAIRVAGGFQYQNVLTPEITKTIASKVGDVSYAFSGDDHDYCEVVHKEYPSAGSGIREVTVKSMSLAMGVRKPGFLLVSLWNPVDEQGRSLRAIGEPTLQTHLCLLPDVLEIVTSYISCLVFTLVALLCRAFILARRENAGSDWAESPILPVAEKSSEKSNVSAKQGRSRAASTSHSSGEGNGMLSSRSYNARVRSISPAVGGYGLPQTPEERPNAPLIEKAGYYGKDDTDDWGYPAETKFRKQKSLARRTVEEFIKSLLWIAAPTLFWYWRLTKY
ncbi:hypothetical protein M8818_004882 [Zalaria obscura]|uniref:Uncharacterized protein n=1 Tax=Zalaria obscura TaxID=2024903 RepID=A0ACC3SAA0_9PEZI